MLRRSFSIIAIIVAALITLYFVFIMRAYVTMPSVGKSSDDEGEVSTVHFPPDDSVLYQAVFPPSPDGSLPHNEYQQKEDSLNQVRKYRAGTSFIYGNGISNSVIGINETERESHRYRHLPYREPKAEDYVYFLQLKGYRSEAIETKFFVENGKFYLAYIDATRKVAGRDRTYDKFYARKEVGSLFVNDTGGQLITSGEGMVLIPVSANTYQWVSRGFWIFFVAKIFVMVYLFLGLPLQIIRSIAKGKAFDLNNVFRFRLMGYSLLIFTLLSVCSPYLLRMAFSRDIPEFLLQEPFFNRMAEHLFELIVSFALLATAKAFERGHRLQREAALTI